MSSTNTSTFPYGKYPSNVGKLMQIAEKNPDSKEKKLLQCMDWCKDKAHKFNGQVLMNICIVSFELKGKFLHEMNKDEIKQTLNEMEQILLKEK
jgi:hypothetical protein